MENKKTSDLLNNIKEINNSDRITIKAIMNSNTDSSYFLLLIITILSFLPFIFVLIFGTVDVFIALQLVLKKEIITLPSKISNISIKKHLLVYAIEKINPFLKRLESLTRNRLLFFFNEQVIYFLHIFILILSIVISIPIPLASTIPGISLLLIVFGILNRDGLFVLFGIITGIISFIICFIIVFFGKALLLKIFG